GQVGFRIRADVTADGEAAAAQSNQHVVRRCAAGTVGDEIAGQRDISGCGRTEDRNQTGLVQYVAAGIGLDRSGEYHVTVVGFQEYRAGVSADDSITGGGDDRERLTERLAQGCCNQSPAGGDVYVAAFVMLRRSINC